MYVDTYIITYVYTYKDGKIERDTHTHIYICIPVVKRVSAMGQRLIFNMSNTHLC